MAPGTRRANRSGYAEHDDFEGLPVRQWRQDWVNVAPPHPQEQLQQNDAWSIELYHGMPKDSALLAPHSQELLRAARSGRLYKRPALAEEEETDADATQAAEKTEKKEEDNIVQGFSIKLWKQVPRNSEGSGLSHLAKRRKGTVTIASKTVEEKTAGPTVTRATVRRIDAAGNPYTEEVTLAEGQQVVGEIISTRVEAAPTAAADGFVAPAPPLRRRPPPPKRKSKAGPGRGKKKIKNPLPGEGAVGGVVLTAQSTGVVQANGNGQNRASLDSAGTPNPDSELADGDEDDDDEDGDEGDEGDDDDQDDGDQQANDADDSKLQDEEMTDAADEAKPPTPSKPVVDAMDGITTQPDPIPTNSLSLPPPLASLATNSPKVEGSPLKNVMVQSQSPTELQAPPIIPTNAAEVAPIPAAVTVELPSLAPIPSPLVGSEPQKTESLIVEPPSVIAGVGGPARLDMDIVMNDAVPDEPSKIDEVPREESRIEVLTKGFSPETTFPTAASREEALLPPPPEQVGNISSPKADDGADRGSDFGDKCREDQMPDSMVPERPPLRPQVSVMTEDTIKPEDSASVRFPLTESGAPSEVGTASVEETKDSGVASVEPVMETPRQFPPTAASPAEEPVSGTTMAGQTEQPTVQGELKQDSPIVPTPALDDASEPTESRNSPRTFGAEPPAEQKEPTPMEDSRQSESTPVPEKPIEENSREPFLPGEPDTNSREEPEAQEHAKTALPPAVANEPLATTIDEQAKAEHVHDQKQEPVEEQREGEHKDESMEGPKPVLEPEPVVEPPAPEPAPTHPSVGLPPLITTPITTPEAWYPALPSMRTSISDVATQSRPGDAIDEKKEDRPADA